jgi:hypothetical protein
MDFDKFLIGGSPPADGKPREMSRGAQTVWIVGTIITIGIAVLFVLLRPERDPNDPYAECRGMFGDDKACIAEKFRRRMGVY